MAKNPLAMWEMWVQCQKKLKLNSSMKTYKTQNQHQKKMSFSSQGLEYKSRKSRDIWSNRLTVPQIINYLLPNSDLNSRKQGKTTRPFRYDLNQIPDDYTVEVTNGFKGLDLINRVPEKLWMEVSNIVQEAVIKTIPKKKKCKKAKCLSEEAL